jgi:outer membrane receptor for ferrienterochelin and colicin
MGTKLTDVLRRVPGLVVRENGAGDEEITVLGNSYGSLVYPLSCQVNIYLDGLLVRGSTNRVEQIPLGNIDQFVPLQWVEAIEVYRRPSETPAEFLRSAACGVVAIWTRRG